MAESGGYSWQGPSWAPCHWLAVKLTSQGTLAAVLDGLVEGPWRDAPPRYKYAETLLLPLCDWVLVPWFMPHAELPGKLLLPRSANVSAFSSV